MKPKVLDEYPQALVPSLAVLESPHGFERQRPSCVSTVSTVKECAPVIDRPSATAMTPAARLSRHLAARWCNCTPAYCVQRDRAYTEINKDVYEG